MNDRWREITFAFSSLDTPSSSSHNFWQKDNTRVGEAMVPGNPFLYTKSRIQSSQTSTHTGLCQALSPTLGGTCIISIRWRMQGGERCDGKGSVPFPSSSPCAGAAGTQPGRSHRAAAGGVGENRGLLTRGLATQVLKDIWVRWLTCVFHSRHPRTLQLQSSCHAYPGLNCTCSAFPMTGPHLAPGQGLHALPAQGRAPGASWQRVGSALCCFYLPPAPFQVSCFLWLKSSLHVELIMLFGSFLWRAETLAWKNL